MKQRGLSPLISGVLMISFTIMIFLLITSWVKEDIIDDAQSNTDKVNKLFSCGTVDVDVMDICFTEKLKMNIDNKGDDVLGVSIKVFDLNSEVEIIEHKLDTVVKSPDRVLSFSKEFDIELENIAKVEIYPLNKEGEICLRNFESIEPINEC
jgi:hypothetical protein